MSAPAIAAGVAALGDRAHVERAVAHNDAWLPRLGGEIAELGLKVTPSVGNFILIHFPDAAGRRAADADAFLMQRGVVLRRMEAYGLPNALRMTIGSAEANEATIAGLARFSCREGRLMTEPIFPRLALIGIGLIGSSIALAARKAGRRRSRRHPQPHREDAEAGARS